MIFSHKQGMYTAVLLGDKTLTTRLKLPAHIAVGKQWAIVPGRAKAAWWLGVYGGMWVVVRNPTEMVTRATTEQVTHRVAVQWLEWQEFIQAAIRIEAFWQTPLQTMTHEEALAEGVGSLEEYAALWDRINTKRGQRWADNPTVWRIRFSRTPEVAAAVERIGRAAFGEAVLP